jgi:hypothetical protein
MGKESWTIYQDHNGASVRKRNGKNIIAKDLRTAKYKQRVKPDKKKKKKYKELLKEMLQNAEDQQQEYREHYKRRWSDVED